MLKGTFALCGQDILGLITSDGVEEVTYSDGTKGMAYTGIKLSGPNVGEPWSSRSPRIVGFVEELLAKGNQQVNVPR